MRTTTAEGFVDRHRTLRTGHVFGVVALACGRPRLATAVALEDTSLLTLDWDQVQRIGRFYPRAAGQFFKNLAALISARFAENTLGANGAEKGPATETDARRARESVAS